MRSLFFILWLFVFSITPIVQAQTITDVAKTAKFQKINFEFHSAFLMNLHHFLYNISTSTGQLEKTQWLKEPSASEMDVLREALVFYQENYAKKDFVFDTDMANIKRALSVNDNNNDASTLALPVKLKNILNRVTPIYTRCIWSKQDQSNRQWIHDVAALNNTYGAEIQEKLEKILDLPYPRTPIRVDIVVDTGTFEGAYTDEQIVLPSGRADYNGLASLEMLYHEATHTGPIDKVSAQIESDLKATGRSSESMLWHAVHFYTVGSVVQDILKQRGNLDYQPYANARIFKPGSRWSIFNAPLELSWKPYMQGKMSMSEAAKQMVDQLPTK